MTRRQEQKLRRKIAAKFEPERRIMVASFARVDALCREIDAILGKDGYHAPDCLA